MALSISVDTTCKVRWSTSGTSSLRSKSSNGANRTPYSFCLQWSFRFSLVLNITGLLKNELGMAGSEASESLARQNGQGKSGDSPFIPSIKRTSFRSDPKQMVTGKRVSLTNTQP